MSSPQYVAEPLLRAEGSELVVVNDAGHRPAIPASTEELIREAVGVGGLAVSKERVLSGSESASRVQGVLVGADGLRSRVGVLVLAGSSGRVDVVRARSSAQLGLSRWRSGGLEALAYGGSQAADEALGGVAWCAART